MSSRFTRPTVAAWVQRTSFAKISRPGIGTACVVGESMRLRHSWYAFVFCASFSTRIIPRHTAVGVIAQRALEREVALAVGRDVLLERVVVEVLRPVGEVRAR